MQPTPSTPGSTPSSTLLTDLRAEVGAESAPLLQFILRHAGLIACGVGLFVLVLVGAGIWSWRSDVAKEEAQAELARLSLTLKGEERTKALGELAARVPSDMRFAVLSAQAQSAAESQDWAQAARIFSLVVRGGGAVCKPPAPSWMGSIFSSSKGMVLLPVMNILPAWWVSWGT